MPSSSTQNRKATQDSNTHSLPPQKDDKPATHDTIEQPAPTTALQRLNNAAPSTIRPNDVIALQRSVGNQAAQRLIHAQQHPISADQAGVEPPTSLVQRVGLDHHSMDGAKASNHVRGKMMSLPTVQRTRTPNSNGVIQRKLTVTDPQGRSTEWTMSEVHNFLGDWVEGYDPEEEAVWEDEPLRSIRAAAQDESQDYAIGEDDLESYVQSAMLEARGTKLSDKHLFHRSEDVNFGKSNKEAVEGYAKKNIGMEGFDFTKYAKVVVTTKTIDEGRDITPIGETNPNRRKPLNIPNYSIVKEVGNILYISGIKGEGLAHQFALALKIQSGNKAVEIDLSETPEHVSANYDRLMRFFRNKSVFQGADTLIFGYKKAFEKSKDLKKIAEENDSGWDGTLYVTAEGSKIAVMDSDKSHSYHVEILAQSVQRLLNSQFTGHNIQQIYVGGSAGSLLSPNKIHPYSIFTPNFIETDDVGHQRIENALRGLSATIKDSVHKSVLSAFVESPKLLKSFTDRNVFTVDMEFGFLARVISEYNRKRRDPVVQYGVALLVTDYPNTHSEEQLEDKQDKGDAQEKYVELILQKLREGKMNKEVKALVPTFSKSIYEIAKAYNTLHLSFDASYAEVVKRYRSLAKTYHPDQGGSSEMFVRIQEAYERITKKERGEDDEGSKPMLAIEYH